MRLAWRTISAAILRSRSTYSLNLMLDAPDDRSKTCKGNFWLAEFICNSLTMPCTPSRIWRLMTACSGSRGLSQMVVAFRPLERKPSSTQLMKGPGTFWSRIKSCTSGTS